MRIFKGRNKTQGDMLKEFPEQAVKDMERLTKLLQDLASGKMSSKKFEKEMKVLQGRQEEFNRRLREDDNERG